MVTSEPGVRGEIALDDLRERVLWELNQIIDPCSRASALPAGLVDMGLVRALVIQPLDDGRHHVAVALCVTHPFCMMPAIFLHEADKRLKTFDEIASSEVSLDVTTLWTEELMSNEYRGKLAMQRAQKGFT